MLKNFLFEIFLYNFIILQLNFYFVFSAHCSSNQITFNNKCYLFVNSSENWSNAKKNCTKQRGYLIVINDQTEFNFTKSFFLNSGLTTLWVGLEATKPGNWYWADGTSFSNNSSWWCTGEPNNSGGTSSFLSEGCGDIWQNGCFNDLQCLTSTMPFICEFDEPTTTTTTTTTTATTTITTTTNLYCPNGTSYFNNRCYGIYENTANWKTAESDCKSKGGYLIIVNDQSEMDYLANILSVKSYPRIWIGLYGTYPKIWWWVDNTTYPANDTWWCGSQPDNAGGTTTVIKEDCGEILASKCFNDRQCTDTLTAYMCEFEIPTTTTLTTTTTLKPNLNCPNGTFGYSNCYSISQSTGDWNTANNDCAKQGGYLVIINDQTEFNYLQSYMKSAGLTRFWIGLNATKVKNWFWIDSSSLSINDSWWSTFQPDNFGGNSTYLSEGCGEMWKSGINDAGCSIKNKYLCEFYPKIYTCMPYDQNSTENYCNLPSFFLLYALLIFFLFLFHYLAFIFIMIFLAKSLSLKFSDKLRK